MAYFYIDGKKFKDIIMDYIVFRVYKTATIFAYGFRLVIGTTKTPSSRL